MTNVFIKNDFKNATKMNHKIFKNIEITSQEDMIIKSLYNFYENDNNISIFLDIINLNSIMSIFQSFALGLSVELDVIKKRDSQEKLFSKKKKT